MAAAPQDMVREFIAHRFLFDADPRIEPTQSLIKTGVMDSTGVMELVFFLEDTFKIKIADTDLVPQNLDSLRDIAVFVQRKLAESTNGKDSRDSAVP